MCCEHVGGSEMLAINFPKPEFSLMLFYTIWVDRYVISGVGTLPIPTVSEIGGPPNVVDHFLSRL